MKFNKTIQLATLLASAMACSNYMVAMEENKVTLGELMQRLKKTEETPSSWRATFSNLTNKVKAPFSKLTNTVKDSLKERALRKEEIKKEKRSQDEEIKTELFTQYDANKANFDELVKKMFTWQAAKITSDTTLNIDYTSDQVLEFCEENALRLFLNTDNFEKKYNLEMVKQLFEESYTQANQKPSKQLQQTTDLLKQFINYQCGIQSFKRIDNEEFFTKGYLTELIQALKNLENIQSKLEDGLNQID